MMHELDLVEIAYDDDGNTLAHIEGWGPTADSSMQTVTAEGKEVLMVTSNETPATYATVKAAILQRITDGLVPYVLPEYMDTLGLTAAVFAWATDAGD